MLCVDVLATRGRYVGTAFTCVVFLTLENPQPNIYQFMSDSEADK